MNEERFVRPAGLDVEEHGGQRSVRLLSGQWLVFGGTAGDLWNELETARTKRELIETLSSKYAGSAEQIEGDVVAALEMMEEYGAVRRT